MEKTFPSSIHVNAVHKSIVHFWASDCFSTQSGQVFSYIIARTSYIDEMMMAISYVEYQDENRFGLVFGV